MFENNLIAGVSGQGGGYSIEDSLRFNDNDSAYLSRTPATAGNRKTWTWSAWVKRGNLGNVTLFDGGNTGPLCVLQFYGDQLRLYISNSDITASEIPITTALFRDPSGWYHVVCVLDTTEASAANRVKFYVNGIQQTVTGLTGTIVGLNSDLGINRAVTTNIGVYSYGSSLYFDGYMAEINFIDGQALTPDDFGEINEDTGEWSPKRYAGTYGTNGFYLPFDGNANDSSGNGNNWTENNLASTDYMIDTPTNSFAVLNPLVPSHTGSNVFSQGNLRSSATDNSGYPESTIYINSGKWYVEMCYESGNGVTSGDALGFTDTGGGANSFLSGIVYRTGGQIYINGSLSTTVASYTVGDIVAMSIDADSGEVKFYKNNTLVYTGSSLTYTRYIPYLYNREVGALVANFGADSSFAGNKTRQGNTDANGKGDFYYAPPAGGYLALCTDNLPEPAIEQPETQFNVVTYTGNGTSQDITGVGFQPDFVWIKARSGAAREHVLFNSIAGANNSLSSSSTNAEYSGWVGQSFLSDGFRVDATSSGETNTSAISYVAWCWKAGGTAVSNTDGSITSQVSANVDSGFSVVSYTGTGANATVGHGLSSAPEMMLVKDRDSTFTWRVYHASLANTQVLYLSATAEATTETATWNSTSPTSTVLSLGTSSGTNGSSLNYIAYAFHSVEGFSKFGSYVGNGSTNGTFVYTGFKPAFVMIKVVDVAGGHWVIHDSARDEYNESQKWLFPSSSSAEQTTTYSKLDFLSNGFKIRSAPPDNVNYSGGTLIYMAFAEHPFKYATGR
jgi:hypothetical protein